MQTTRANEPGASGIVSRLQHWIGVSPETLDDGVMCRRAVALPEAIEDLREQLMCLGSREVQPRPFDTAMQRRPHDAHCLGRSIQRQKTLPELIVDPRVAIRR